MIAPVYLVKGDDPILVAQAISATLEEVVGDDDASLIVEDLSAADDAPASAAESAGTPNFLAPRRVLVIREIGRFTQNAVAPLVEYLAAPMDGSVIVLGAGGGTTPAPLVKAVQKVGQVVDAATPRGKARTSWVLDRLHDAPVKIDAAAARLIEGHLGEDIARLDPLITILTAAYGPGAKVGPAEVEPYLGEAGSAAPWDLTDAIDKGDPAAAIEALRRLLGGSNRYPLGVMSSLHTHVARMARLDGAGVASEADAAALLGIAAYPARKALTQSRRLGSDALLRMLTLVSDADVDLRGRSAWAPELVLEVLVARLARAGRTSGRSSRRAG
ncbi:MAG TPA: DNA polymerase III subunit delta [Acidimicrobiales bacterium]|nr:DNA polymerase III subunit delta [Acidimicrobiales bacterium]